MRKTQLLTTAAAVLLIGTAAVSAQGMKKDEGAAPAPAAQQNAPAEKVAPAMKPGDKKAGAETKKPETTGQAPKEQAPAKAQMQPNAKSGADADGGSLKSSGSKTSDKAGASDAAPASDRNASQSKSSTDIKAGAETKSTTTGQGAAAGSAKLSTEQRTKITSVIRQQKVAPAKLNVAVSVGTRLPASVHFYPLPREVVVIYPEWRGYDYILVGDQIVIVDPRTHEIVAILEA